MKRFLLILLFYGMVSIMNAQDQNDSQLTTLLKAGRLEEARAVIRKMTETEKASDKYLFLHAWFSLDADSATIIYQQLIDKFPQSVYIDDALFRLAQLKYAQGLYKTSLTSFKQILSGHLQSPLHPQCYYWIGLCYQAMDFPDSAKTFFQMAGTDNPDSHLSEIAQDELKRIHENRPKDQNTEIDPIPESFSIQVGAFSSQTNALINKSFYENEGYRVHLRTKMRNGQQMYLVWLESFSTREEAEEFGETLIKKYDITYLIVLDK